MGVAGCLGGCLGPAGSACITGIKTARRGGGPVGRWAAVRTKIFLSILYISLPLLFLTRSPVLLPLLSTSTLKRKRRKEERRERREAEDRPKVTSAILNRSHIKPPTPYPFWCWCWGRGRKSGWSGGGPVMPPHSQKTTRPRTHRRAHTETRPGKMKKKRSNPATDLKSHQAAQHNK